MNGSNAAVNAKDLFLKFWKIQNQILKKRTEEVKKKTVTSVINNDMKDEAKSDSSHWHHHGNVRFVSDVGPRMKASATWNQRLNLIFHVIWAFQVDIKTKLFTCNVNVVLTKNLFGQMWSRWTSEWRETSAK